ncbi:MAG TPA: MBL fold metallo-hydrolase [Anaerolineales bacterium]|nr:MBL fold metallo-hydrolase [Anaerolineales bacterium]
MATENIIPFSGLSIITFTLGPAQTNAYLVGDTQGGTATVIDPAWDGDVIVKEAERQGWRIASIWLTHAHFDHFGGAARVADSGQPRPEVALHPDDQSLWRFHGGAALFGFQDFDPGPEPTIPLRHGMLLQLGSTEFEVRHTPGHTPGHVIFLARREKAVFCGDLVFQGSVGRTDLPGGDWESMARSLREEILSLPDDVRLFCGHGPQTTVGRERRANPFLREIDGSESYGPL